ncbi:putative thiamine transporter SLC35F3 [Acanthaster planci]|uniref:Thiamine transporter SLC35F3 n=1 Tax=Acanthaster planci TaxID=133434 RepID=A0A8B7XGF7_ACAPL|nr:putative thiamine transporter SLC35F3 [Acanthaster planci]XP_022079307.1 putative thiamine transporter SLC35F3 [Acanthaster planci]
MEDEKSTELSVPTVDSEFKSKDNLSHGKAVIETSFSSQAENKNGIMTKGDQDTAKANLLDVAATSDEIDAQEATGDGVPQSDVSGRGTRFSENIRKTVFGLIIVIGIAVSWVGATQFTQSTYSPDFSSASVNVWFSTSWMLVCYPVYVLGASVFLPRSRSVEGFKNLYSESEAVFGRRGLCLRTFATLTVPFAACWAVTNYLYVYALGKIAAADVTALFSSNTAFIYIFSWLWLHERLVLLPARSVSVLMSIGGMVLISYADGFEGPTALGISFSIGSAIGSAVYKVLFKRYVGNASSGQVSLFLSVLGIFNILFLWPFIIIFYYTDVETWSFDKIPWDYLCGSAALSVAFNFLINFGIALTFPLFIALGTVVGIPLNAVVDLIFRGKDFSNFKIGGSVLVIVGFLIMLIPENIQQKAACWTEGSCPWERRRRAREDLRADDAGVDNHGAIDAVETKCPEMDEVSVQVDIQP